MELQANGNFIDPLRGYKDNWLQIERWCNRQESNRCQLHIPYKERFSPDYSMNNYMELERWANTCPCCSPLPLHVPYKEWGFEVIQPNAADEPGSGMVGNGDKEFGNWQAVERWAERMLRKPCDCAETKLWTRLGFGIET